jgi:hypothetical protein
MKLCVLALLLLQFGPRPPLSPAETLLAPETLRAIIEQAPAPEAVAAVTGADADADILVTCAESRCGAAALAVRKLHALVAAKTLPQPARSIRVSSTLSAEAAARARAVIHVAESGDRAPSVVRGLWSTAGVGDEVAELFARHLLPGVAIKPYEAAGQLGYEAYGVPTTTIVANPETSHDTPASMVALTAYFLATLPNAGAEALLSHLTVGAHARLAEDGRAAVAQMGREQRAGADVLIMFGQAIEREQRRMRSFERFMPAPVDPMLRSRIADMERGITGVWTSMGITSAPFVPAAERIRGRGGEDRRVAAKTKPGAPPAAEPPSAFLRFPHLDTVLYELGNLIDGRRTISDIRDALSAEFGPVALPVVVDYIERLARAGAVTLK